MEITLDDLRLRDFLKQAVTEALDERRDFFRNIIDEEIEDILLGKLIERDRDSELVPETVIMELLHRNREG